MLKKLHIRNYALIEDAVIEMGAGLNVLTGETGAGKSLLVGAIGLILGKRLDSSKIFNQEEKCIVEAQFGSIPPKTLEILRKSEDFDLEEDGEIIIRREASASGKSRAFINDTPVTLEILRENASRLVDLHGQHQNQQLLSQDFQAGLLDSYADNSKLLEKWEKMLHEVDILRKEIKNLRLKESESRQQLDYFTFQLKELKAANLQPESDEQLEDRLQLQQNAEEVSEVLNLANESLYNGDESLYNSLAEIIAKLHKFEAFDPALQKSVDRLREMEEGLQETTRELEDVLAKVDLDPELLEELEARNDLINRLKMKFGVRKVAELADLQLSFESKVSDFSSIEGQIKQAEQALTKKLVDLSALGLSLENERIKAGKVLSRAINALLADLGIPDGEFMVDLERTTSSTGWLTVEGKPLQPNARGFNRITFQIRTNKGIPHGPLSQIASGGEVSRVMLAIKTALAERTELSVLIFDEIDTGISGETANRVARVMKQVAKTYQLITITHLPQIAGCGNRHFRISKEIRGKTTTSRVEELSPEDRIQELAKMLSGDPPSSSALQNAKELMNRN